MSCLGVRTRNAVAPKKPPPPCRNSKNSTARDRKMLKQNRMALLPPNNENPSNLFERCQSYCRERPSRGTSQRIDVGQGQNRTVVQNQPKTAFKGKRQPLRLRYLLLCLALVCSPARAAIQG